MDSSNAEQLTDAEPLNDAQAEAVPLALEEPLKWETKQDNAIAFPNRLSKTVLYGLYAVEAKKQPHFACYEAYVHTMTLPHYIEDTDYSPLCYKSMIDAKAACERHHATGKWESEQFPKNSFREEHLPE